MKQKLHFQEIIDKAISGGIWKQIIFLSTIVFGFFILILGLTLIVNHFLPIWDDDYLLRKIYTNFIDIGTQCEEDMLLPQIIAGIIGLLGSILLTGLLISTFSNIFERRVEAIRLGKVTYKNIRDHYVIIGFSEITVSLIKELCKKAETSKIIIMSGQETEYVRRSLQAQLDKEEEKPITLYFGNIESADELKRLNLNHAKEIYILGESDEYGRDSKNIGCTHKVCDIRKEAKVSSQIPVYVQFDRIASYSIIQKMTLATEANIYFRPFNFYENWARLLWSLYSVSTNYSHLDYRPIRIPKKEKGSISKDYVHLVIVGFGKMGRALLLEALRICHFANYDDTQKETNRIHTIITIIDKDMDEMKNYFTAQYPYLKEQIHDIKIEYRKDDICSPNMREEITEWLKDKHRMMTIAICVSEPDLSLSLGLNLPSCVYEKDARVLIRQELYTNLGELIDENQDKYKHVKIFGMLDRGLQKDMLKDQLSAYIHQYYTCQYCKNDCQSCIFQTKKKEKNKFIKLLYEKEIEKKDASFFIEKANQSWSDLSEPLRWANRYQIDIYGIFCRTLGYDILKESAIPIVHKNVSKDISNALPYLTRMEKYRWNAERTIAGYRYDGTKKKDDSLLTHPLIMPYNELKKKHPTEISKDKDVVMNFPYLLALEKYKMNKY